MTPEQIERLGLSEEQVTYCKEALLSNMIEHFRKVAMVIVTTMMELKESDAQQWDGVPDEYYLVLIKELVADQRIESQGNLNRTRHSEIRLKQRIRE